MAEEEPINPRATLDAIKSLQLPSLHIISAVTAVEDLKFSPQAMYADQTSPSGEGHTANPSTPLVLNPSSRPNQPVHNARVILLLHTGVASLQMGLVAPENPIQ